MGQVEVTVQVVDERPVGGGLETRFEDGLLPGDLLREPVPAAELPFGLAVAVLERLPHEIVVVGRDVDREAQIGQDSVRLIRRGEIGRFDALELPSNGLLWVHVVPVDGQELRHSGEVGGVVQGVIVLFGPLLRHARPRGQRSRRRACADEGCAFPVLDEVDQLFPILILEFLRHSGSISRGRSPFDRHEILRNP